MLEARRPPYVRGASALIDSIVVSVRGNEASVLVPALAVLVGALSAVHWGWLVLVTLIGVGWLLVWSLHWRAAFIGLFLFIPVAAVPGILLQQEGWPTLIKEALFLIPGYLGLFMTLSSRRDVRSTLPASLTVLLVGLSLIVIVQAVRVVGTYPLVALIGIKTWLLYIPLVLAPTAVFTTMAQLSQFIRLIVLISIVPSLVALLELALIATGHADVAYGWYGALQSGVTQEFAQVGVSDEITVRRIPSTFTFFTQFVAYCLLTTPFCVLVWMSDRSKWWRYFGAGATVLIFCAGFASGSRTFYFWGPLEIAFMVLLIDRNRVKVLLTAAAAVSLAALVFGNELLQVASFVGGLGWDYVVRVQVGEFATTYQIAGLQGIGAGLDTNGSRYVLPTHSLPYQIEGWYALTFLELGLPGLVIVALTWLVILRLGWRSVRLTRRSDAAPIAICLFVILVATFANLYKGESLEYDPLNVYLWFVVGLALALPSLAAGVHRGANQDSSRQRGLPTATTSLDLIQT